MATYQQVYEYVNAELHYAYAEMAAIEIKKNLNLLRYFKNSPEEIAYKACWEAYFNERP